MRKLQKCLNYKDYTVESGINVTLRSLFLDFFQGLRSYYGLKRLRFYYISLHILRATFILFVKFSRGYTFIQGATSIPDSRVSKTENTFRSMLTAYNIQVIKRSTRTMVSIRAARPTRFQKMVLFL